MTIEIDGSHGEGGGQILRVSVALAAVTGKPIKIHRIRVKRSPPGIRPQHETAVRAVAQLSQAEVKGLNIGSTELEFHPHQIRGGKHLFDTGTAGSTSLVLQSLMPAMAFAEEETSAEIRGGTNNPLAPPIEYIQEVLAPTLAKMSFKATINLAKRGFYPKGGGIVHAKAKPTKKLNPINLTEFGETRRIHGIAYSSKLPNHIVERIAKSAEATLKDTDIEVSIEKEQLWPQDSRCAISPGCGIVLFAETSTGAVLGSDSLGEIGKPSEKVGREAAETMLRQLEAKAPADRHLEDQLIIYMALASGRSELRVEEVTPHTVSCIYVANAIADADFETAGEKNRLTSIICRGIGLENASGRS